MTQLKGAVPFACKINMEYTNYGKTNCSYKKRVYHGSISQETSGEGTLENTL